ncbi:MAG: hypothetical protein IJ727_11720 [Treponema sp.]|nr:hypothetical protein [Treponema sp.]
MFFILNAPAHVGSDYRSGRKYRAGSPSDFRFRIFSCFGNRRSRLCHGHRADCGSPCCNEKRILPPAKAFFFHHLHKSHLQTWNSKHSSYNYGSGQLERCRKTVRESILFGMALMLLGTLCFEFIAGPMFRVFTRDEEVIKIGIWAFKFIGLSFIPMVTSLMSPLFFRLWDLSFKSSFLTVLRTVILFVPLGYVFSRLGLDFFWLTFPITESLTSAAGLFFYAKWTKKEALKISVF